MSPANKRASVDVFWRSNEGFETHLQLIGGSPAEVIDEAKEAIGAACLCPPTPGPDTSPASKVVPSG